MTTVHSTASVQTDRAARYGKQLVSHLGRRSVGVWDDEQATGSLTMNDGTVHVTFTTTPDALLIDLEAAETDQATFQDVVARHLVRFATHDELTVEWQTP